MFLYTADIWGLEDDYCHQIEKQNKQTHKNTLYFCITKVSWGGSNDTKQYDIWRYCKVPIVYKCICLCNTFWLKITILNEQRLPYKAYLMLLHLDEQGKNNWVTNIRTTLVRFGFEYVWQNKGVQEVNLFIRCFRQRLINNRWQDWKSRTDASDRFNLYRQFKTNHVQAVCLSADIIKQIRNSLIKFRFGVNPTVVHSL